MTDLPLAPPAGEIVADTWWRKVLRHPLARMVIAAIAIVLSLALSFGLIEAIFPKEMRVAWPNMMGALACAVGYWIYVNRVERRKVIELGRSGAVFECTRGVLLGALLGLLTIGPLGAIGAFHIDGVGGALALLTQLPEMALVSVFEELLMRAVIFRIAERAWGSWRALALSTVIFVVAHLPGNISVLGMLVTAAASIAFTAAYQLSGRLWLPIGMHFAWNYLFSGVLSIPVSGHEAKGWIHGAMTGPDWLTGGAYGVEASAGAFVVWTLAAVLLVLRSHARGRFVEAGARSPQTAIS